MAERVLSGIPASPGAAAGSARLLEPAPPAGAQAVAPALRASEAERALEALRLAGAELEELAATLRSEGRDSDAEIVETGVLMAGDPALGSAVTAAVLEGGLPAAAALTAATDEQAAVIAALDDPLLAGRAADVRSLGRRAARLAAGDPAPSSSSSQADVVLVARDLGPADVAELRPEVRAIALAAGGVTAHAAIVARSLGLPMVVGIGDELLGLAAGAPLVVDGSEGVAVLDPSAARLTAAEAAVAGRTRARARAVAEAALPAVTRDGHRVSVLVNAATAAEAGAGLDAGAEGAGLIRTELSFLDAASWPSEDEHLRALAPVLAPLRGALATVRVLDFGGDKTPPFLRGVEARGIELLLQHPEALADQLRAIVAAGGGAAELRVLLPLASSAAQLAAVRELLDEAVAELNGAGSPALGAMVETVESAANAGELGAAADFLSVGTNDLTASALGVDRFSSGAARAHDPLVLRAIAETVKAARGAGVPVEVCGEAASDPLGVPILIGLGVDELSVGAVRVGTVRAWVRALALSDCEQLARAAVAARDAGEVERAGRALARELALAERGDAGGEGVESGGGVLPVGPQP